MLRNFTPRLYQQTILATAATFNTLVVLPTGLGKTAIAFLLACQRLHQYPSSKILMLSPTKPLCEQHVETFRKHLDIPPEKVVLFTGSVAPEKRAVLWTDAQIIVSTPQGLENDVINRRVKLEEVSLLIFDEAHHATGDYSYVWLAQQYDKQAAYARILALTASPGSDLETIKEICGHLKIERVEVRTEQDADVKPYVQKVKLHWEKVEFPPEFAKIREQLRLCKKQKLQEAEKYGYCNRSDYNKMELLNLQGELQQLIASGERDGEIFRSVSLLAEVLKIEHGLELLESQGLMQLHKYIQKLKTQARSSKVQAVKNLVIDEQFKGAAYLTEQLIAQGFRHPKLGKLQEMLLQQFQQDPAAKAIVFTQYRNSAEQIALLLKELEITHHIFVGQAKKEGMGFSQKEQKEILDRFRGGEFNVLIATSVAEEGLDIPKVDKVIFYEPIPSAIRAIQRRGRTGRLEKGEVTMLITAGTRDEAYRWSSFHKEKQMYRNLHELKKGLSLFSSESRIPSESTPTLQSFAQPVIAIVADHREKDNKVVKELIDLGMSVKTGQLEVADYIISGKVAVELKKIPDFVDSIIDGRLLEQVRLLKQHFEKAVLVMEGEEDIYSLRKIHANAIRGMLASIVLDFGVPILYTKNSHDTACLLAVMAKREHDQARDFSYHERKPQELWEQQEYFVSSLPGVGVQTARKLLEELGSVKELVNARREKLLSLDGVGEKTAERLLKLFEVKYQKE